MASSRASKVCIEGGFPERLSEDLLAEIFKKLPGKEVCRIRLVCKTWNSLISSSFFITQHHLLTRTPDSDAPKSYFLWNDYAHENMGSRSYAFYDPRVSLADQYPTFLRIDQSPLQGGRPNHRLCLVDVVHGVACLSHPDYILLSNPVIRKYVDIPTSPSHQRPLSAIGFGFESPTKYDYGFKVVTIRGSLALHQRPLSFEVFSTRGGGRWRSVAAAHIDVAKFDTIEGCFSNGAIYWIVSRHISDGGHERFLLMFDCEHEELKTMELPRQFNRPDILWGRILNYGGALSIFLVLESLEPEMWAMEEHGDATTWNKSIFQEDFIEIADNQVHQYEYGRSSQVSKKEIARLKGLRVKQPLNAYVFEESMLLMDINTRVTSKEDGKGNL